MTEPYNRMPLEELERLQEEWVYRDESEEDPDYRQEWVAEGIEIHKALVERRISDDKKAMYFRTLAELYLEYGRSEKMIQGNHRTAFRYLQRAARARPEKGDTFYHLAFLAEKMTWGREKWESAAFYAKEAMERGVDHDKKIKILCLLGKAYAELGFTNDAAECFNQSKRLDREDEYARFRASYSKKTKDSSTFVRLKGSGAPRSKRAEQEALLEKSRQGTCFVLETNRHGSILHGNDASMPLNPRQAEFIKLFFEWKEGLDKYDIINHTMSIRSRSPEAVKAQISRLRSEIKRGLEVDGKELIQTVGVRDEQKYMWNPALECHLLEKV
ncbi:tetratricopeptide repeat protein [Bacillus tuaregi]|uniref:tetratricopeptide repeat protein n=1 Tax=Bacillus tuaregi TaxID=1816695 RepID=UPI0008F939FA|nr:hypothetical protein [Bacillus tuaregi]